MKKNKLLLSLLLLPLFFGGCASAEQDGPFIGALKSAPAEVYLQDGSRAGKQIAVTRNWNGSFCRSSVTNNGKEPVRIKEVVLFSVGKVLPPSTPFYGEGFQMLSQYTGTLEKVKNLGYPPTHYKLPEPPGYRVVYNLLRLQPARAPEILLGFNSCNRFSGKFYLSPDTIKVVMDIENLELKPGATFQLEEFSALSGPDGNALLDRFAGRIHHFHPRLASPEPPTGWCSWYCFGSHVTAEDIYKNLDYIKQHIPELKYIQLDDGYQPHMGDWLEVGRSFGGNVREVLKTIREKGFEPAIWVAPFICDSNSTVFKEHPDWLVKGPDGQPLRSDKVTFGGWRWGPWYALDGTNPAVQKHFEDLFRTMQDEWGCTYFKLDANYWGAIQGGRFYDTTATRVEAYRRGMEAILKGAGHSFILGCNHPLWPSLGLIHGSRSSGDIKRSWSRFVSTGRQNLYRAWQNGKLWWNDPDCVLLTGDLPDNEFMFHASLIFATGGMLLSGDDLTKISPERLEILHKLVPSPGVAARFDSTDFVTGRLETPEGHYLIVLNWEDGPRTVSVPLEKPCELVDYWTGKSLGRFEKEIVLHDMPGRYGRVFRLKEQ